MTNPSGRSRRAVLATLGAAVTAGCLDGGPLSGSGATGGSGRSDESPVRYVPLGESVELSDGGTVSVSNAAIRKAVVATRPTEPVRMQPETQYVVADVSASGDVSPWPFTVLTDGEPASGAGESVVVRQPESDGQRVAAPVRRGSPEWAALAWVRGIPRSIAWRLPASVREDLADGPAFEVRSATVTDDPTLVVSLTVANTGSERGEFHASVRNVRSDAAAEILSFEIPPGDVVTHNVHPDLAMWPAGTRSALRIDWGTGSATEPVGM